MELLPLFEGGKHHSRVHYCSYRLFTKYILYIDAYNILCYSRTRTAIARLIVYNIIIYSIVGTYLCKYHCIVLCIGENKARRRPIFNTHM